MELAGSAMRQLHGWTSGGLMELAEILHVQVFEELFEKIKEVANLKLKKSEDLERYIRLDQYLEEDLPSQYLYVGSVRSFSVFSGRPPPCTFDVALRSF
eukprot:gene22558-29683_t